VAGEHGDGVERSRSGSGVGRGQGGETLLPCNGGGREGSLISDISDAGCQRCQTRTRHWGIKGIKNPLQKPRKHELVPRSRCILAKCRLVQVSFGNTAAVSDKSACACEIQISLVLLYSIKKEGLGHADVCGPLPPVDLSDCPHDGLREPPAFIMA
jgi:hypothetical protein